MADDHGIPEQRDRVKELAEAALTTGVMMRAVRAAREGKAWREVWVASTLGDDVAGELEGQIDLIFEDPDNGKLVIVDYKTDRVEGRDIDDAAAPYFLQMGAYALMVERATRKHVDACHLVFASLALAGSGSDANADYRVPDLDRWKEAARSAARRQLSVSAPDR
jgi:RecB family exonuclease